MNNDHDSSSDHLVKDEQEQVTEVNKKEVAADQADWKEKFIRLTADFDNYKRRTAREQIVWFESGQQKLLADLLPIVDNFDRALKQSSGNETMTLAHSWLEGFALIRSELHKYLHTFGVEQMKNNQQFDPVFHEAIAQVSSDKPAGTIIEVVQEGYMFKGKVLRPAKVVVAH